MRDRFAELVRADAAARRACCRRAATGRWTAIGAGSRAQLGCRRVRCWRSGWAMRTCARASTCSCRSGAWRSGGGAEPLLWVGDIDPAVRTYLGAEMAAAEATGTSTTAASPRTAADWLARRGRASADLPRGPAAHAWCWRRCRPGCRRWRSRTAAGRPTCCATAGRGVAVPLGDAAAMVRQCGSMRCARPEPGAGWLGARQRFAFDALCGGVLAAGGAGAGGGVGGGPELQLRGGSCRGGCASIFAQTLPVREVVVLDDASGDDSVAAARRAAAEAGGTVGWCRRRRQRGSVFGSGAGRRDWRGASSLWIAEADDLAEPGFLAALAEAMRRRRMRRDGVQRQPGHRCGRGALWRDHQAYLPRAGVRLLADGRGDPRRRLLRTCLSRAQPDPERQRGAVAAHGAARALDRCGGELADFSWPATGGCMRSCCPAAAGSPTWPGR